MIAQLLRNDNTIAIVEKPQDRVTLKECLQDSILKHAPHLGAQVRKNKNQDHGK